jgi:hypothetical protein
MGQKVWGCIGKDKDLRSVISGGELGIRTHNSVGSAQRFHIVLVYSSELVKVVGKNMGEFSHPAQRILLF